MFAADVKGDLAGIAAPGKGGPKLTARARKCGMPEYGPRGFSTVFWDLNGKAGHPIRTTVSELGPVMLARLLELNDTQEGVLNVAFTLADENGWLLLDLDDLRAILNFTSEHRDEVRARYGNVSPASVGAIQRRLLVLERDRGAAFFGEPAFELSDFLTHDDAGFGNIHLLAADTLVASPRIYATFLLWLLSELFEQLPEVGDPDKPKLVFFFDEAHLLFDDAPKALLRVIERVVRLIRSKGVGVYFVTQSPMDIPDEVLGQLGNRVQHALRAYTPRDSKIVRAAAATFRQNPAFDCEEVVTQLEVGEALVSTLGAMAKSTARSIGTQLGRQLVRGVLGTLLRR